MTDFPILLVLGPSGTGKSSLGAWLAGQHGWLHIEIDQYASGDGIDLHGLRAGWSALIDAQDGKPLAGEIEQRARSAGARGAALTFPSPMVLSSADAENAARYGLRVIYLYGSAADCIESFSSREKAHARGLDFDHWLRNNARGYFIISRQAFALFRVNVFAADGTHLPWAEICADARLAPLLEGGRPRPPG